MSHVCIGLGSSRETQVEWILQGNPYQEICPCAGNETKGVIPWLHILPEMDIGMVEYV